MGVAASDALATIVLLVVSKVIRHPGCKINCLSDIVNGEVVSILINETIYT